MSVRPMSSVASFKDHVSLLSFHLIVLSSSKRGVFKSPTPLAFLSVSCSSVTFFGGGVVKSFLNFSSMLKVVCSQHNVVGFVLLFFQNVDTEVPEPSRGQDGYCFLEAFSYL